MIFVYLHEEVAGKFCVAKTYRGASLTGEGCESLAKNHRARVEKKEAAVHGEQWLLLKRLAGVGRFAISGCCF